METGLKSNDQRGRNVLVMLWIMFGLEFVAMFSGFLQYNLLAEFSSGLDLLVIEQAEANDMRESIIGVLYTLAFLISAIVFIRWFRRAYYNLHQKTESLSHSEGWAAGAWFTPFVNLYLPYKIMKELFVETKNLLVSNGIELNKKISTTVIGLWWAFWITNSIVGQVVFRMTMNAETIPELQSMTIVSIISNIIGVPLALITIKVINNYREIEPFLAKVSAQEE